MISLNQQNQNLANRTAASRVKSASNPVKEATTTTTTTSATFASHQFLPPKTVRQVKQRSAERQYTTPDLRSTQLILSTTATAASTGKPTNLSNVNTFSEQNKHLRKLSNSIQNLHNNNNNNTNKSNHSVAQPPPKIVKQLGIEPSKESQLDLMNKLNKINTDQADQMSLSSSSVECLELGNQHETDQMLETNNDNDLDIINQPNSSSHTTNSLTSSSSSSCSLFENQNDLLKEEMSSSKSDQQLEEDKLMVLKENGLSVTSGVSERCGEFSLSGFPGNGLKKPVTFASIKAASSQQQGSNKQAKSKSAMNSPNVVNYSSSGFGNNPLNSSSDNNVPSPAFSNSKIDSIRSEFIQNIKNLQFILSQVRQIAQTNN